MFETSACGQKVGEVDFGIHIGGGGGYNMTKRPGIRPQMCPTQSYFAHDRRKTKLTFNFLP